MAAPAPSVEVLDAAAARAAAPRLAELLIATVAEGAAVTFLAPLACDVALAFWRRVVADVGAGHRRLLVAREAGRILGTVQLALATPPNQPHRAEVVKLLVDPAARRRGLGRALMLAVEAEARSVGRRLLTLDTRRGDAGEALYRALGWVEAGFIPDYALNSDGTPHAATFFWKSLG